MGGRGAGRDADTSTYLLKCIRNLQVSTWVFPGHSQACTELREAASPCASLAGRERGRTAFLCPLSE